jgi:hypothetical protein
VDVLHFPDPRRLPSIDPTTILESTFHSLSKEK